MKMPLKRFWMFSESIDRMNSEQDIRAIRVASSVLGDEAYAETMEKLNESVGIVAVRIFEKDQGSIDRLKSLMM